MRRVRASLTARREPSLPGAGPAWMTDRARRCSPDHGDSLLWTSDRKAGRAMAAALCGDCPFVVDCGTWAAETGQSHFVYGGKDFSQDNEVPEDDQEWVPDGEAQATTELVRRVLTSTDRIFGGLPAEEQVAVVRALQARGWTWSRMAKRLSKRVSDLQQIAEPGRPTFDDQVRDLHGQDMTDPQIAKALGVSVSAVAVSRRLQNLPAVKVVRRPQEISPELREQVVRLWNQDLPDGLIGLRLGMGPGAVNRLRRRIGLPAKFGARGRRIQEGIPA